MPWGRNNNIWCNPPFGVEHAWVEKAVLESAWSSGNRIAMIFPVKSSMKWWSLVVRHASNILFVQGRMKFVGMKWQAPFPVVLVLFSRQVPVVTPKLGIIDRQGAIIG